MDNNKSLEEQITELLLSTKREGIEKTVAWLKSGYNYFVSAGSEANHDNWKGGLASHSWDTYQVAGELWEAETDEFKKKYPFESVILASLLHDVCKIDVFVIQENGFPKRQKENRRLGHGFRSLKLLKEQGLKLTRDEELSIWWHMGEHELEEEDYKPVNKFQKEYEEQQKNPFCILIQQADGKAATLSNRRQRQLRKNQTEWNAAEARFRLESSKSPRIASEIQTEVYKHNLHIFETWSYKTPSGKTVSLGDKQSVLDATKVYRSEFDVNTVPKVEGETITGTINEDCLIVAKQLIDKGHNPAILNLADALHACGMYNSGSSAQEESLCRASTLSQTLYQYYNKTWAQKAGVPLREVSAYPMGTRFGGIYSPRVTVFRGNKSTGYELLEEPFETAFISVAALNFREKDNKTDNLQYRSADGGFTTEGEEVMLSKIRTIYRIALANGHDSVILGAFGCGVFDLKPELVADLFSRVLSETEFAHKFRLVLLAILEGKASVRKKVEDQGPFAPFYKAFGRWNP